MGWDDPREKKGGWDGKMLEKRRGMGWEDAREKGEWDRKKIIEKKEPCFYNAMCRKGGGVEGYLS